MSCSHFKQRSANQTKPLVTLTEEGKWSQQHINTPIWSSGLCCIQKNTISQQKLVVKHVFYYFPSATSGTSAHQIWSPLTFFFLLMSLPIRKQKEKQKQEKEGKRSARPLASSSVHASVLFWGSWRQKRDAEPRDLHCAPVGAVRCAILHPLCAQTQTPLPHHELFF